MKRKHAEGALKAEKESDGYMYWNVVKCEKYTLCVMSDADGQPGMANGQHIVACWNACVDINPEAVLDMLEALKATTEYISQQWEDDWENRPNHLRLAEQAIAKAAD